MGVFGKGVLPTCGVCGDISERQRRSKIHNGWIPTRQCPLPATQFGTHALCEPTDIPLVAAANLFWWSIAIQSTCEAFSSGWRVLQVRLFLVTAVKLNAKTKNMRTCGNIIYSGLVRTGFRGMTKRFPKKRGVWLGVHRSSRQDSLLRRRRLSRDSSTVIWNL